MDNISYRIKSFFSILLGFILIFIAFYLVTRYYSSIYPPIGNDFYHSFNSINFFKNNLTWPHLSWKYIWYFGGPSLIAYPWLNFYLVQPFIKFWGMYQGSLYYFLGSLFLYGFISYLLFYRLSKSFLLSAGLAISLIWSASTWRLIAAGSLTLTVNQFFLALALFLIIIYLQNQNRKYLFLSALVSGFSIISQSGSGFPFIIPVVSLTILAWWQDKAKFWQIKRKMTDFILYLLASLLIASFYFYYTVVNVLGSRGDFDVFDWMKKEAFSSIVTKTNPALFILLIIFFGVLIILREFRKLKIILPFLAVFIYLLVFNLSSIYGLSPFGSSLAPAENWYIFTLIIALLVAILWSGIRLALQKYFKRWILNLIILTSFVVLLTPFGFWQVKELLENFRDTNFVCGAPEDSVHKAMVQEDLSGLDETFPSWFKKDDLNWRFFSLSWCVDLWWNSFYKMPITGGYDTLLTNKINRNYINWTNEIFNGTMAQRNIKEVVIKNNMLFHIDWLGGRYLEKIGDFAYLEDPEIIKLDNKPEGYRIFEFKNEITSPIVKPTNVPTILFVSTQEGFDTMLRILAQENLNSRYLIPVQGPHYLEDLTKIDLSVFDSIFLYDYHYRKEKNFKSYPQKPWQKLLDYVKNGGTLFIETGSEVKESDIKNLPVSGLPEVFPIKTTSRGELGTDWHLSISQEDFLKGVKTEEFDQLIYQDSPWKLSYTSPDQLKPWATPILSQRGNPILVSGNLEQGKVIWSGLNLPYHIKSYNNIAEGKLLRNLLDHLINLEEEEVISFEFERKKSENILIKAEDYKGILFKESYYPGWQAKQNGERLEIYKAGFSFMYIPVKNQTPVSIRYLGETKYWLMFVLSLLTIFLVLVYSVLGNRLKIIFNQLFKLDKIKKKTKSWWERDEE